MSGGVRMGGVREWRCEFNRYIVDFCFFLSQQGTDKKFLTTNISQQKKTLLFLGS